MADPNQNDVPAPWELFGKAYICFLRSAKQGSHPLMMFVDYERSPVGPYYELLFIPGYSSVGNEEKNKYLSISRIFVSSMSSVRNGRRNWGIPKDFAEFDVRYNENGIDHVTVRHQGNIFAELAFQSWPFSLPFTTRILPKSWRAFMQSENNSIYRFYPESSGWFQPARLIKINIDQALFPAVNREDVMGTIKITHFQMTFPKAEIDQKNPEKV